MHAPVIPPSRRELAAKIETPLKGINANAQIDPARTTHAPHRRLKAIASRPVIRIEATASATYHSAKGGKTDP